MTIQFLKQTKPVAGYINKTKQFDELQENLAYELLKIIKALTCFYRYLHASPLKNSAFPYNGESPILIKIQHCHHLMARLKNIHTFVTHKMEEVPKIEKQALSLYDLLI